ncbi:MAG: hypothetical protein HY720_00395 [Planctomycetes bacterium]|nr:hypothetical protein [Planctomycetota bacterium]
MPRPRPFVFLFLLVAAHPAAADDPAPPEVDSTWTTILGGESFSGWEVLWPEFWTLEDGAVRARTPAEVTWKIPEDVHGAYETFNFIRTRQEYPSFHMSLEVQVAKGKFGVAHWGTMKKTLSDSFFYGHDGWCEFRMTWRGGKVLLWFDGKFWDDSASARQGENSGRIYLYLLPDSDVRFRNFRMKTLPPEPGNGEGRGGREDEPRESLSGLLAGGLDSWEREGSWELSGARLEGRSGAKPAWIRRKDGLGKDGRLSFEVRGTGRGRILTVLADVSEDGREATRIVLPPLSTRWVQVEIDLSGDRAALTMGGRPEGEGKRGGSGAGIGFALAAGGSVDIRRLEFEPR